MHNWAPVPHAHAHLGAGAPCACTIGRQLLVPMHTSAPVPNAPALCSTAYVGMDFTTVLKDVSLRKERAVYAEVYGHKQPQAFGHNHRRIFPHMSWACAAFPRKTHGPNKKGDACRMDVAECSRLIAATCLGIDWPFGPSESIVHHSSEFNAMHATAKRASAWGMAPRCACARGTGAQVYMRKGHRRPSVHVQWNTV